MVSTTQQIIMNISSTVAALISVVGSSLILTVLFRSPNRLSSPYRRIMCGLSIMDIIFSLSYISGGFMVPVGTPGALFAYGNTATCNLQGLMQYVGYMGASFYVSSLSIYYLLTIRYAMSEQTIAKKIEPFLHIVPILYLLVTGIYLMCTNHFNFAGQVCWIAPEPLNCLNNDDIECVRGENSFQYRWIFQGYPTYAIFAIITTCLFGVVWTVYRQWGRMDRFRRNTGIETPTGTFTAARDSGTTPPRRLSIISNSMIQTPGTGERRRSSSTTMPTDVSETVKQALMYIGAFVITFVFAFVHALVRMETGKTVFLLWLLGNTLLPLQGFFNFAVFIRPRITMIRRGSDQNMPFFQVLWAAIISRVDTSRMGRRGSLRQSATVARRGYTARELHMMQQHQRAQETTAARNITINPPRNLRQQQEHQNIGSTSPSTTTTNFQIEEDNTKEATLTPGQLYEIMRHDDVSEEETLGSVFTDEIFHSINNVPASPPRMNDDYRDENV